MKYPHWHYYKSILHDLESLSRYIEIAEDNYRTYSIELTRLLLSIGSEVDVVAKLLCKTVDGRTAPKNIEEYRELLCKRFPSLPSIEVSLPMYLISLTPWNDWSENKTPKWWVCYNKVKHERSTHFREANLENTLFACAGLCVLICYLYYKEIVFTKLGITPLFMFLDPKYRSGGKVLFKSDYKLPDFNIEEKDT